MGLPVDESATSLIAEPRHLIQSSVYEMKETVLLATSGADSVLAVHVRATGRYADGLRQQLTMAGRESVENERLQDCARRYAKAARIGPLQVRDNRAANEFWLAEIFQINGFLAPQQDGRCTFHLPPSILFSALQVPENKPRSAPFGLPHPCQILHTVEIESQTLQPMAAPRFDSRTNFYECSRRQKSLRHAWSMTLTFETLAEAVPATDVEEYRMMLERLWRESVWSLVLPVGYHHPRRRSDFGELPPDSREATPAPTRSDPPKSAPSAAPLGQLGQVPPPVRSATEPVRALPSTAAEPSGVALPSRPASRTRQPGRRGVFQPKDILWLAGAVLIAVLLAAAFYQFVLRR